MCPQEANPMTDDRFSALFSNPDFQVDTDSQVSTNHSITVCLHFHCVSTLYIKNRKTLIVHVHDYYMSCCSHVHVND